MPARVFLGGSCGSTTWRADTVIPLLEQHDISYFSSHVAEWHEELVGIEAAAKAGAEALLFFISDQTRGIVSMLEAAECICAGRPVFLVVAAIPDGLVIEGQAITGRDLLDLRRGRVYLRDIAARHGCTIYEDVTGAAHALIEYLEFTLPASTPAGAADLP
jgi:hypothetical protein